MIQEKIYDEEDVAERNMASAVLTRWAAIKIAKFVKQKVRRSNSISRGGCDKDKSEESAVDEQSPLLKR